MLLFFVLVCVWCLCSGGWPLRISKLLSFFVVHFSNFLSVVEGAPTPVVMILTWVAAGDAGRISRGLSFVPPTTRQLAFAAR